jgi:adenylate kinase family enzyme
MDKIIVIGCPGSGKTTFSEKLNKITGIPLYHLDTIWHKPDKTHIPRENFDNAITEIFLTDKWIIDGNYNRTIEIRLKHCDTVFLFDLPTEVCIQGATKRLGKERYDLPWIEKELSPSFKQEIEMFRVNKLPNIYELLDKYKESIEIVIFKSRKASDEFIESLKNTYNQS